jgi:kynurenine/2-aminoadipate aminotransferase
MLGYSRIYKGNPTGYSTSAERKKEIYEISRLHEIIILEDDPYYLLQFDKPIQSYFSMDVDGRVLRFDSFSKVLSAGIRLGYVSGPQQLVERIMLHEQVKSNR